MSLSTMTHDEPTINPKYLTKEEATDYPDNSTAHTYLASDMADALQDRILNGISRCKASEKKKPSPYTAYGSKGKTWMGAQSRIEIVRNVLKGVQPPSEPDEEVAPSPRELKCYCTCYDHLPAFEAIQSEEDGQSNENNQSKRE